MKEDLEYLENYLLTELDIHVEFGRSEVDAFYYEVDVIGINTKRSIELQLFCLLHEAGHAIIRKKEGFANKYSDIDKKTQRGLVDVVCEEIDAWQEGRKLADRLGISIDDKRWKNHWKRQVYKYVRWAANGGT